MVLFLPFPKSTALLRAGNAYEMDADNIEIYANRNQIFVNIDEEIYHPPTITIHNTTGQIVFESTVTDQQSVFDVQVPSGNYLVNLQTGVLQVSKMVVVGD